MFKYRVFFEIDYQAHFGEYLVIVGSAKELGNWDVSKGLRMHWNQSDLWKANVSINHKCDENCEYKYVLCREEKMSKATEIIRWEEGPNRLITFKHIQKLMFSLRDIWGFRKLCFHVPNKLEKESQCLKITGNLPQMGSFQTFHDMKLIYQKPKDSDTKEQYWEAEFIVDPREKDIIYCYSVFDKISKNTIYERKKFRRVTVDFSSSERIPLGNEPSEKMHNPSKYMFLKNDEFIIYDSEFQNQFIFNEINKNIVVGPCPQTKEEVELLEKNNVKAILNLQRDEDMDRMNINWPLMKEIYAKKNMVVINYQIKDKSPDQIGEKIIKAAYILNEMILKYNKVYVHCTAGKIRSPYTVMVYLCLYKGVPLNQTIETMKMKRPIALAKKNMLLKVIQVRKQVNPYCLYV